ncbi:MFS transporter [Halegenticoccus soli]|uniref:MFS transporter n=1 Tax=Halegenticoccus soli TaxID=1985678 RepID=UPI00117B1468|nr:MFS transporter [Halegenticoccus soli]
MSGGVGRSSEKRQRLAISIVAAASKGSPILMGTAMAVYIGREGGSPLAVSLVLTALFFGHMVFGPLWGAIADITGRRRTVLLVTSVAATFAALPLSFIDGIWAPLGIRTLYAAFLAGLLPVMLTIVNERGGADARGRSVGLFSSAQAIGFTCGQLAAGTLLGLLAPWSLYLVVTALTAVVALAALVVEDPTPTRDRTPTVREILAEVRRRLLPEATSRDHLESNGLKWLYAAVFLRNATVIGISSLLPVYLVSELDVSEPVMGVVLAINPAVQIAFMYVLGRAADTVGRKPLIVGGMVGTAIHGFVMAAAILPADVGLRAAVAGVSMFTLGAAFSALTTGSISFIGDVAPTERESELIGLRSTARGLGGTLGPPLFGLGASLSSFELTFAVGSCLALAGALLVTWRVTESHAETTPVGRHAPED